MMNKISARYLIQFVLIIGVSFGIVFAVSHLSSRDNTYQAEASVSARQ